MSEPTDRPTLREHLPEPGTLAPDQILDRFLDWVAALGLEPYPAQEDALLELMAGRHVILNTPTGSGKSLVAVGQHFKALCEGRWSFYTSPTKALASEKFFDLCATFGPENVGMLTGDASVNRDAPIVCCTAEILSNMVLRDGPTAAPPYVVMDEFHYYADRDRGVAWQVPLIALPDTTFLLMSATLGDMRVIGDQLERDTGRHVALVRHMERPVPLDYAYRETPIQETVKDLLDGGKAPLYIVSFTHRDCAELAQALTSIDVSTKAERAALAAELAGARLDTPYGRELGRFLRAGIAVHHGGLLPRYRLLVEGLAQSGLLKVICGTDTLGVGVNIPIRTVLFNRLAKYDGRRVRILSARDFKQIAGRAGRKGFDDQGSVVAQAPEHVIERKRLEAKAAASGKRRRAKKPPPGTVVWDRNTFHRLIDRPPEPLASRFRVDHGMIVNVLQRPPDVAGPGTGGYGALVHLVGRCHEDGSRRRRLLVDAAARFRALRRAGLVETGYVPAAGRNEAWVSGELQEDFSLYGTLALYLVDAVAALDPEDDDYALDVLTLVEAILEHPRAVLFGQERVAKGELVARLKAERVPYEERMAQLDEVTYPQPRADFIHLTFDAFARAHPWVGHEDIRPKSVAREIYEGYFGFAEYVRRYGLQRAEGSLLRYLSQAYKTLVQSVPDAARTDELVEIEVFLRTMLWRVDSSLVEAWERLMFGEEASLGEEQPAPPYDLAADPRALEARVRVELGHAVRALAARDYEAAADWLRPNLDDPWDASRLEEALAPFLEEHGRLVFEPRTRKREHTLLRQVGARRWDVVQVLVDPEGHNEWHLAGRIDLAGEHDPEGPLMRLHHVGT